MRNLGLDLLRLVAIILVLGRHFQEPVPANKILQVWHMGGWVGVDLFFVLSGFLVSGLLYKEYQANQCLNSKRFLIRRGLKIYPPFYFLITVTIIVDVITKYPMGKRVFSELLFLQNYFGSLWNHTWSLAVEEHFYIGISFLFLFLLRRAEKKESSKNPFDYIPLIFIIIASTCLSLRIATFSFSPTYSSEKLLFPTHLRIDSLMFGSLLSYLWYFKDLQNKISAIPTWALIILGVSMLTPAFMFPIESHPIISIAGVILFYIGSGSLVLGSTRISTSSNPIIKFFGILGAASYSIYLWHLSVTLWIWPILSKMIGITDYYIYVTVYISTSLALGWLLNKVLEWPVLQLRDRIFPAISSHRV